MESLELRIFREVAYEKSISKAAEKMGYVQSNLTAHIHNLEEELGTILFLRHSKGITLTEDGQKLLSYADKVIDLLNSAEKQFRKEDPVVKIGATQIIVAQRLPVWLFSFKQMNPDIRISVSTDTQTNLVKEVADGNLDCAFVNTTFIHPKLISVLTFRESLAMIVPKDINTEEIAGQPIIVANMPECPYRNLLENWVLEKTSRRPDMIEFDTLQGIVKAVTLGMGISILPISALPEKHDFQVIKPDGVNEATNHLVVAKNHENASLNHFIEIVRANIL